MELSILNLKGVINNLCNFALSKLPYRCHAKQRDGGKSEHHSAT